MTSDETQRSTNEAARDSGRMRISFRREGDQMLLTGIYDEAGANWLAKPSAALWRLDLSGPEKQTVTLLSEEAAAEDLRTMPDGIALGWSVPVDGQPARVRAAVRLEDGANLSAWSLEADLPAGWTVARADFPRLATLRRAEGQKLAAPTGWGLEYDVAPGLSLNLPYPSWEAVMQFIAFYENGAGLYVGTHDPNAHNKDFAASAEEEAASVACIHYPAMVPQPTWRLPYAVTVGLYAGGWLEATRIYRDFALTTPWARTPLRERAIPEWLRETELWLKPGETPWTDDDAECIRVTNENVERCKKAKAFFDVPISLHWYRWHQIPYDTLYPEYFPPKAGFQDGVKAAQAAGFRVMPYINGRLCDPNSATWNERGGSEWAARDDAGQPYTELYGSKVPLNVMCPNTEGWQATIAGLVKRLVDEIGADGVYIDQITAAKPFRCLRTDHGHAPGGGNFWLDAYRALLDQARANLPEDGMLTSEENAECWMDRLDGQLVVNTPAGAEPLIPLFPAVYAGRALTFGFQYFSPAESAHSLSFRAKMARAFLWGAQLGWINADKVMDPAAEIDAGFMRAMCRTRRFAHDFLLYGSFVGPVEAAGDNPRMVEEAPTFFGGTYTIDLPAVMATAWKSDDGRLGVALANMDDAAHAVTLELPLEAAGLAGDLTLTTFGPEGKMATEPLCGSTVRLQIPAREARLLVVS